MTSRFDFEQQIMDCWGITDDLKILSEYVLEDPTADSDKITNITIGLEQLYAIKFEKLFNTFETMIREGNIV